jgi:hypothetical protein
LFRVVLRLGEQKMFKLGPTFFLFTSYMTTLYLLKYIFSKFDPLTATGSVADPDPGSGIRDWVPF